MSLYTTIVRWDRDGAPFVDRRYSRAHRWEFDGGISVRASASPSIVPSPMSDAHAVDPEEAFVASIAACHMLFFLSFAAEEKFVVNEYVDHVEGILEKDANDRLAMTRVTLRPEATFDGRPPDALALRRLHDRAHHACFIANSVRTQITVDPVVT